MNKEIFLKELSKRIVEARKIKKISQAQLASLTNCDSVTIWRIENSHIMPNSYLLYKIIRALEITPNEFFENFID
ncbi:MAG: helix-turn-helix domain-containing protein [Fusobacteriaceae bacterium]